MKIGIVGEGAIAGYVVAELAAIGLTPHVILTRPQRVENASDLNILRIGSASDLPEGISHMVDCAGHGALAEHGPSILARGIHLITVSLGALADPALENRLAQSAKAGGVQLHLASGAIGALDALRAASVGGLDEVTYVGRKPPMGWKGSRAENTLDLDALTTVATHFDGSARHAATAYPKNANVAAAVALAGLGFDRTRVHLIADPDVTANIHEIRARGSFGAFSFRIEGNPLPDNPRSSALAAMSVVSAILRQRAPITT